MGWDFACMRLGFSLEALQNGPCSTVPRELSCDNSTRLSIQGCRSDSGIRGHGRQLHGLGARGPRDCLCVVALPA